MLTAAAMAIALFFAMNIGASGTAASMSAAYGSGAIRSRRVAMLLVAICAWLGAILGGGEVVKTMGSGIIPSSILNLEIVLIILVSATATLFTANILGIPLSTSEVSVGSIVGVGLAYKSLYIKNLFVILSFWIFVPFTAFIMTYVLGKGVQHLERRWPHLRKDGKWQSWFGLLLIFTGSFEAFSAGMNNVANAVGPLVGVGLVSPETAVWVGGGFVGLGALLLGSRVLETNSKSITRISLLQGSVVSATGGFLVFIASLLGIPVPLTQATTGGILGVGVAEKGFSLWQKNIVKRIIMVWIVSPLLSLIFSFGFVHLLLIPDPYILTLIVCVFLATVGSIQLSLSMRKEKRSFHDHGGGI